MNVVRAALVAALAAVLAMPAAAQPKTQIEILVTTAKPPAKSGPICGGVVGGKAQARCGAKPATYESKAVGECPKATDGRLMVFDIGLWQCWSCPKDFSRTAAAVDTERACGKPNKNIKGEFTRAQYRGPLCPSGSFHDPIRGGECWNCPSGYKRSAAHVEAANACFIPTHDEFRKANRHARATGFFGTDCPGGQFWDGVDGHCYNCPSGFNRTGYHIHDNRSCSRHVGEQQARATVVRKAQCEAGEFHDLKIPGTQDAATGGGCWKCPTAHDRTTLAVDGTSACEKGGGIEFAKAKYETALTCPAGQHFDFIGVSDSELGQLKSKKLATPSAKSTTSGTCWSCPAGFKRSGSSVNTDQACLGIGIEWYTAPYPEPGLFGIAGAEAAVLELVRERKAIEVAIEAIAKETNTKLEDARKAFWDEIRAEPENSPILKSVAQAALVAAIEEPGQVTAAQKALVQGFAAYYRDRRTYLAKDALAAYDAWKESNDYWKAQEQSGRPQQMTTLFDTGTVPPDFHDIVHAGVFVGLATGAGLGAAWTGTIANPAVHKAIFPFARKAALRAIQKGGIKAGQEVAVKLGEKATQEAVKQGLKVAAKSIQKLAGALKALSSVGPQIVITVAVIIATAEIEKQIAIAEARPKLSTAVAGAQQAPNFSRMIDSDQGYGEITGYWDLAVSGSRKPSAQAAKEIAEIAAAVLAPSKADASWEHMPGIGKAIGVGANGSVWHIGTNKVAGGFGVYRWDNNRWTNVPGGAVRIAVDPKGNPWVVNDQNNIFRHDGRQWHMMPGAGTDIGIGANGSVWVVGTNKVAGGFGVHRWDNTKWTAVSGGAVRIAVDPKGNPWVVNDRKQIFRHDGRRWIDVPGLAIDIGVGANGLVYHVGTNKVAGGFGVYAWDGKSWQGVSGGLTQIAVAPDGRPFGINETGQMFWMK